MCEIVYNILITNFTVHRCIIRSNAPSNLQMQPLSQFIGASFAQMHPVIYKCNRLGAFSCMR